MTIQITKKFMSEAEFARLAPDGRKWERVDGEARGRITGCRQAATIAMTAYLLDKASRRSGMMTCGQAGFRMANGNIRCPDVSFTRKGRLPDSKAPAGIGPIAPDLCVEVISPSEEPSEMRDKMEEYFASGAVIVWHVFPESQRVVVFTSPTETETLEANDTLTGEDVVPGFSCQVSELFDID